MRLWLVVSGGSRLGPGGGDAEDAFVRAEAADAWGREGGEGVPGRGGGIPAVWAQRQLFSGPSTDSLDWGKAQTYRSQQNAVEYAGELSANFIVSSMPQYVQPLGQTAGLKLKAWAGMLAAHPEGWHDVKRASATLDARTVTVSNVPLAEVATVVDAQIESHPGGGTKGVVKASGEGSVGDMPGAGAVVLVADGVWDAVSPPRDVGLLSAIAEDSATGVVDGCHRETLRNLLGCWMEKDGMRRQASCGLCPTLGTFGLPPMAGVVGPLRR